MNDNRIVPITSIDLLTNYGVILNAAGENVVKLDATDTGIFVMTDGTNKQICSEPVKSLDFGAVTAATFYFIAAYDFEGFKAGDAAVEVTGDIENDVRTLYKGVLASGGVTVTKVGA